MNGNPQMQQGAPPRSSQQQLIRPDQIRNLPSLNEQEKGSLEHAIKGLYDVLQAFPPDHAKHQEARSRLESVTMDVKRKHIAWLESRDSAAAGQGKPGLQQSSLQGQPGQPQGVQQQIAPGIVQHLHEFQYFLPPQIPPNTVEAESWFSQAKDRYATALQKMDVARARLKIYQNLVASRKASGQSLNQDEHQRMLHTKRIHEECKTFVERFRQSQSEYKKLQQSRQENMNVGLSKGPQDGNPPTGNLMSKGLDQKPNPADQQAQQLQSVNNQSQTITSAADSAARNQSNLGNRGPMSPSISGTLAQQAPNLQGQGQGPTQVQAPAQAPHTSAPGQPQFNQPSGGHKITSIPANVNMGQQYRSPQTPHPSSATPSMPRPLHHQAALSEAERTRTFSNPGQANSTTASPFAITSSLPTGNLIETPKMPIPKQLNVPQPQPVNIAPSRPTMSGGAGNGVNGTMGQPALPKTPGYTLEGEGERVLSKKKLDELVRQVSGGGEGLEGPLLSPAVEELVLQLADDFVDQLIVSACQLAKARDSQTLDIRDIQLILERNYNIRIPGYALDEIRTVRKFVPTAAWTQKLQAVQAAKITGGKQDT
ncbi:MAG: Transcription initiation factor TFIID subunit 12 [Trizodia sp. TS-e1964]|nr:MAG: Transcription initiation factor TFIID subunit 12 [Trizodia sp. TS-e1964]